MTKLGIVFVLALLACGTDPSERSPEQALRAFLSALERSTHAPEQRRAAYELLASESQRALTERARLATSLGGRAFEPWELLVPARSAFAKERVASPRLEATVEGDRARVTVPLTGGRSEQVALVREQESWRVLLALPH